MINENDILNYDGNKDLRKISPLELRKTMWQMAEKFGSLDYKFDKNSDGNIVYTFSCRKDEDEIPMCDTESFINELKRYEDSGMIKIEFCGNYFDLHPEENGKTVNSSSKDEWIAIITIFRDSQLNEIMSGFYLMPQKAKINALIEKYRSDFDNACEDVYYGYSYETWRNNENSIEDDEIAKLIWDAAVERIGNE